MSPLSDGKSSPSQATQDGSNYGSGDNGVFRDDGETGGTIAVVAETETSQKNNSGSGSVEGKSKNNLRRSLRLRGKHTTVNNNTSAGEKREAVDSLAPSESNSNKRRSTHSNDNDVSAIGSRHLHHSSSSTSIDTTTNGVNTLRNRCLQNCQCVNSTCRPNEISVMDVVEMPSTQIAVVTESYPNYTFDVKFQVGNGKEECIIYDENTYEGVELLGVPWYCLDLAETCNTFDVFKDSWGLDGHRVMVISLPVYLMNSVILCDGPNATTIICEPEDATE